MSKKIKELKELELNDLRSRFKGVKDYVILEPIKVDAGTEHEFRRKLRDKKCVVRLVKNTLARKVFTENGPVGTRQREIADGGQCQLMSIPTYPRSASQCQ